MTGARIGQKYPILFLIGPQGSGKSRLADRASQTDNSPVSLVTLRTTRPLGNDRDRRLFKRISDAELETLRATPQAIAFECQTSRGHYAILHHSIVTATTEKVGLVWAPSEAALRIRNLGFQGYVMYIRPVGRRGDPDVTLDIGDEQPVKGLQVDEYYPNMFVPGGLALGVEHVLKTARRLYEPLH